MSTPDPDDIPQAFRLADDLHGPIYADRVDGFEQRYSRIADRCASWNDRIDRFLWLADRDSLTLLALRSRAVARQDWLDAIDGR
jgi:hypothetical protein